MKSVKKRFSNFSQSAHCEAYAVRPSRETELSDVFHAFPEKKLLARGQGLSYSDCCLLDEQVLIDTQNLNHLLEFNAENGILVCQGAATFKDLLLVDPNFIPPVIPGTLHATVAGGVANDVHGKNNHKAQSFGHHIAWLELQISEKCYHCSPTHHQDLFWATIGGVGLTGIIKRVGIRMQQKTPWVEKKTQAFQSLQHLLQAMQEQGIHYDYQVAWLDLLNQPNALLTFANHISGNQAVIEHAPKPFCVPKLPLRVITPWMIKQFNRFLFYFSHKSPEIIPLWQFNNPLDRISHWNYVYGSRGLLQFQAVFPTQTAFKTLETLISLIKSHRAQPMLCVLKYFTQPGKGMLSFVEPGFTLALDFINTPQARKAITAMNQTVAEIGGKVYLAKDLLLNPQQFSNMYTNHQNFFDILEKYQSPMYSDLAKRLGFSI